jgi:hypothetical protein
MEEGAAADRPFIAALAISGKACGTSHKPLTAFDHPHILIGKSPQSNQHRAEDNGQY